MGLLEVMIGLFAIGTPLALYFVLARGRHRHAVPKAPAGRDLSHPPADYGLDRDAHPATGGRGSAEAEAETSAAVTNSAAAAAGGSYVVGWEVTHRHSGDTTEGSQKDGQRDAKDT